MNSTKTIYLLLSLIFNTVLLAQPNNPDTKIWDVKAEDRICFALYTVHENTLKLTAQLYPTRDFEPMFITLEIAQNGTWETVAETRIIYPGYTAPFRVENWDDTKEVRYRVAYNNKSFYEGIIRKNPVDKEEFVMAAFSCNSLRPDHGGDISRQDIISNMEKLQPDLLFFAGDQVYHHNEHLVYWLKFGRDFGDIIRNTPTVCLTDDHDVGQGNLWGAGGQATDERRGFLGGYYMPAEYVKEVERAQTSHLPDPYNPTPVEQGINVYYTDLKWGGMSFAILEDRKFKSGLTEVAAYNPDIFPNGPRDAIFDATIDTRKFNVPGVTLLGDRQLQFLEDWTIDWEDADMKSVLSQTVFAQVNNYTGKRSQAIVADFDTNGWPQSGRNKALSIIRKSFSCMVAGDQHLASIVQHGIDNWGDAGYSFATPAMANFWLRWWDPEEAGNNRAEGAPDYTGDFLDGFQNKMTVHAVANPPAEEIAEGGKLSTRAAGFGVVTYNKKERNITFECWPRNVDITDPASSQYPGWPVTISQTDNFAIKAGYELPMLTISELNQVVTVRKSTTNEVVSSLRINGNTYQPKVQEEASFNIEIGEGGATKRIFELRSEKNNTEHLEIILK